MKKKVQAVRIPEDLHARLKEHCKQKGVSMAKTLTKLVEDELGYHIDFNGFLDANPDLEYELRALLLRSKHALAVRLIRSVYTCRLSEAVSIMKSLAKKWGF